MTGLLVNTGIAIAVFWGITFLWRSDSYSASEFWTHWPAVLSFGPIYLVLTIILTRRRTAQEIDG
ncbi:hypothetical protein [Thalassobium sp. R2A62]|uniref:hypothetical protein n=1 Tax=Thalassobium sp. R2A62 TaxID=633131 RepID=UPI0001B1D09D|nr:hypothetical protein [Thalassobium sp. R2A62]EET46806.1 hypothetical protein TR2A62_0560 [Thalassobium sp. R2A62]